ncbi:hypothetical protein Lalb_Chr15g0083101 [Lupinus albus]|uniref:Uncharacterized protein n=1 Tax=Lupinus albus TaxID=3870 RepID=A0A6A4PEH3_LUPAL|nr:hypothetical protein Lalb_Chr15g0083101 [Lupinus albus]
MASTTFYLCFMLAFAMTCFSRSIPTVEYERVLATGEHARALHHAFNLLPVYRDSTNGRDLAEKAERLLAEIDYQDPHTHPTPPDNPPPNEDTEV